MWKPFGPTAPNDLKFMLAIALPVYNILCCLSGNKTQTAVSGTRAQGQEQSQRTGTDNKVIMPNHMLGFSLTETCTDTAFMNIRYI